MAAKGPFCFPPIPLPQGMGSSWKQNKFKQNFHITAQEAMESSAFLSNLQFMLIFCQMAHTQKNPNVILLQFSWATKVP